jgi:hypothetical protein
MSRSNPKLRRGNTGDKVELSWHKTREPTGQRGRPKNQNPVEGKGIRLGSKPTKERKTTQRGANKLAKERRGSKSWVYNRFYPNPIQGPCEQVEPLAD